MNRKLQLKLAVGAVLLGVTGLSLTHCGSKNSGTTPNYSYAGSGSDWVFNLNGDGTFTATESTATVTVSGTFSRLASGFDLLTVTASSGTTAPAVGSTAGALEVPGVVLLVKPMLSSESQIITAVATGTCPSADFTANWIQAQSGTVNMTSTSQDAFGTFQWTQATSTPTLPTKFAVQGYTSTGTGTIGGTGTCAAGIMTVTGAKMYLTAVGGALVKMSNGNAALAMPVAAIASNAALAGNYAGLLFDNGSSGSKTKPVSGVVNAAGTSISVNGLTDITTGALDSTLSGTVSIDAINAPSAGFLEGTVTAGSNTGKLACMVVVNAVSSGKNILFCVGQSPGTNANAFNILLVSH